MATLCIIGLPNQLRRRLEPLAREGGLELRVVAMGPGRRGKPKLLPDPNVAVHTIRNWTVEINDDTNEFAVLVLPYAPIPSEVEGELDAMQSLGFQVRRLNDGIPKLTKCRLTTSFLNELFAAVSSEVREIVPPPRHTPSDSFRVTCESTPTFIIADSATDHADEVADHRYEFMRRSATALGELAAKHGKVGPLDQFFEQRRLAHAKSGATTAQVDIFRAGAKVESTETEAHLKQGDATTLVAAARVYYATLDVDGCYFVILLYAGPHPDGNIAVRATIA